MQGRWDFSTLYNGNNKELIQWKLLCSLEVFTLVVPFMIMKYCLIDRFYHTGTIGRPTLITHLNKNIYDYYQFKLDPYKIQPRKNQKP